MESLDSIRNALGGPSGGPWVFLVIGLALLGILLLLLQVLVSKVRQYRRVQGAWGTLAERMGRWRLNRQEAEVLRELARRESPWNPLAVVERLEIFERAVHRYLNRLRSSGSDPDSVQHAADYVHSLRQKLNLAHPGGTAYYSTRELADGQQVHLTPLGRGEVEAIPATVRAGREDYLALSGLGQPAGGLKGRTVEAVFFRGKNAFSFESEVVAVGGEGTSCLLTHTLDIRSAGLREFHRVPARGPVTFRAAWEEPDVAREGTLRDLSAGGLAVLCPCYYETGEKLMLHLRPGACLGQERSEELKEEELELAGTIVDTRQTPDGRCVHHVEFNGLSAEEQQSILKLVRRIEQAPDEAKS
ncbi:MAG: PilZ domain-containing protein [Planctomycetota bacterium]